MTAAEELSRTWTISPMIGLFKGGSDPVSVRREDGGAEMAMLF